MIRPQKDNQRGAGGAELTDRVVVASAIRAPLHHAITSYLEPLASARDAAQAAGLLDQASATPTFSARCDGPNLEYRLDGPPPQEFVDTYL